MYNISQLGKMIFFVVHIKCIIKRNGNLRRIGQKPWPFNCVSHRFGRTTIQLSFFVIAYVYISYE